ncbi:peptidylprolyl isomerase [Hoeflea prorocentri]|uniref:Peptidyl-prolyl cis-trans isomerase n=2 Tax=Hoeflea prorocentri TaxID=1922333 RepID=A0A9X3UHG4_9HYPH|nr:peptidylprolyl isomerase [Hoeflea prorocentri]MCY6380918.1 peptidylprolyl isomerase [Hoeflea prorocentri]MDA5398718.1 peptidylprolyl isomerase [Hoeflea prorocentri]
MKFIKSFAVAVVLAFSSLSYAWADMDPQNKMTITLKDGDVVIELLPDVAPEHVARIRELANSGEYDNVAFHRVIEGFMAQTGDVEYGDMEGGFNARLVGTGGSSQPDLKQEFSGVPFEPGIVGMARSSNPDSANSQFFIMFERAGSLDGQYTVFGRVVHGMEHVNNIKRGDAAANGAVQNPDRMIKVRVGE